MKNLDDPDLAQYLIRTKWAYDQLGVYNNRNNAIMVMKLGNTELRIIAARGGGWDHVSVSTVDRCPTWEEMEYVKRKLFMPDEVAWQYHMNEGDHISVHPWTLHIWRKHGFKMRMPPKSMV